MDAVSKAKALIAEAKEILNGSDDVIVLLAQYQCQQTIQTLEGVSFDNHSSALPIQRVLQSTHPKLYQR